MLEYIAVFAIVAVASYFVGKRLLGHLKGKGCGNCDCAKQSQKFENLVQVKPFKDEKLR